MTPLDWIAGSGLFVLLAIPLYWLQVHPFAAFWKRMPRNLVFLIAAPVAWGASGLFVYALRDRLFAGASVPAWLVAVALSLAAVAIGLFVRVERELGSERLIGKTEISGGGELRVTGLYARLRHPAYTAQMTLMLAFCLLAGSLTFWLAALCWWLFLLAAIAFEERELRARFGAEYDEYRRRVPAFLPFRIGPGEK
ncbi:MAG: isoprenylcysteine carboxylmethyltransferase family protein [Acidobacteria bacterium]|nr:isoprenylcysteine carboxylmethyltransferase family protein [Acidobacteriota bacterium]